MVNVRVRIGKGQLFPLMLLSSLLSACGNELPKLNKGDPAPPFILERLQGGEVDLANDLIGKVVAVHFWADWCRYCASEMQAIEPIYRQKREQGLVILAINVRQDRETAAAFISKLAISYDVLLDPAGDTTRSYGVIGLPATFIIDRAGKLHTRILGESTPKVFAEAVGALL